MPARLVQPDRAAEESARVAVEVARAEAALLERLEKLHAEALEQERALREEAVQETQRQLGEEFAALIAGRFDAMRQSLSDGIADTVASILAPILSDDLHRRMIEALKTEIAALVDGPDGVRLRVSGPQSMYQSLAAALGPLADRLDFTESDTTDLVVAQGEGVVETRLGDWGSTLSQALS
jgi:hypothetical protein